MLLRSHNMNNEFKPLVVFSAIFIVIIGVIAFVLSAQNRRLREQTATAPSNQVVAPTSQPEKVTPIAEEDYTEGLVDTAPVVLVTYADLNCSFCKIYHQTIQGVLDDYGDQVAYVFRHFPIVGSVQQAQAAECVGKAGGNEAFWNSSIAILPKSTAPAVLPTLSPPSSWQPTWVLISVPA